MNAAEHAKDCAKRILNYLDHDITEKRVLKLSGLIAEHLDKFKPVSTITKTEVVYKNQYKKIYIPATDIGYVPDANPNVFVILADAAKYICERHGITLNQLKRNSDSRCYGKDHTGANRKLNRRSNVLTEARKEFIQLVKSNHFTEISYSLLAGYLGYKDHTTAVYMYTGRKFKKRLNS